MAKGYIIVEQVKGQQSLSTHNFNFDYTNHVDSFNTLNIPGYVCHEADMNGTSQYESRNIRGEEIVLTVIKKV